MPALGSWRGVAFHTTVFLLACAVVVARRPDAVFHAQFYAEDGRVWFANAYNFGCWSSLLHAQDGYFQTLPRLGAALALMVPLSFAPLVLNLIAIAIEAIPVSLLLSSRSTPWGSFRFRSLLASLYLVLPNAREMIATITESQWILTLIVFLLLVAMPPRSKAAGGFHLVAFALCCLTGPFCIFLFVIALFLLRKRHDPWPLVNTGILLLGCIIQAVSLLLHSSGRLHPVLGPSLDGFVRILACQVYLGALLGGNGLSVRLSIDVIVFIAVIGTTILILCALSSPITMRALLLLACLLFVAALAVPSAVPPLGTTAWQMMAEVPGIRYWFFPTLAVAWSLAHCTRSPERVLRGTAACLMVVMTIGFIRDFRYAASSDMKFQAYVQRMDKLPRGASLTIPLNPQGWDMRLVKR